MYKVANKVLFNSFTYLSCLLILSVFASAFTLCYFLELSNLFTSKIDTIINVHHSEGNRELKSYPDAFQNRGSSDGSKGFILVSRYFEQQVGAAMNLLTLCKWAKTTGAFPVEPFVEKSSFHNKLDNHVMLKNALYFHDYFDIELWNKMSLNVSAMPLISWNTFMAHNPGKFVFVLLHTAKKETSKLAFVNDEVTKEDYCRESFMNYEKSLQNYLNKMLSTNIEIIRRVCISFTNHSSIHIKSFTDIVYGDLNPSSVVVWFQTWQGILKTTRIKIIEEEYKRSSEVFEMLQNSKRIVDDSKKYVQNILKSDFGKYIAISFRTVKRAKSFYVEKSNKQMHFFHSCMLQLQKTVSLINSTNKVFLALDLGSFGDTKATKYLTDNMIATIEDELFHSLYNGKLTMEKWEEEFVEVTGGITDSGYIAAMQSEILMNSGCLIMFGGDSNFQRSVLHRYKQDHLKSDMCVYEVCYIQ